MPNAALLMWAVIVVTTVQVRPAAATTSAMASAVPVQEVSRYLSYPEDYFTEPSSQSPSSASLSNSILRRSLPSSQHRQVRSGHVERAISRLGYCRHRVRLLSVML